MSNECQHLRNPAVAGFFYTPLDSQSSEKVALARKIEEALAGRNHRPSKESTQNFAELPQGESRDIAAQAVGMNRETFIKKGVKNGELRSPTTSSGMGTISPG